MGSEMCIRDRSDAEAYNLQLLGGIMEPDNISPHSTDMYGKSHSYGPNCTWIMASGGPEHINSEGETVPALDVAPGESVVFTFADFLGINEADLLRNAKVFQSLYDNNCSSPKPPAQPLVRAKQDDHKIVLYWDKRSEQSIDPVTGNNMFQGYRVYRSTDRGSTWGNVVTDLNGNPTDIYQPLAVYDIADGISGAYTMSDPLVYYDLGSESGLQYTFIDENIVNGYEYWYAVTAYDGPDNWAGALVDPMENSKAKDATITDDNTVALIPQVSPAGLDKGGVTGITHHGLSTARFDAITADPFVVQILGHSEVTLDDLKSKGFTYQVDFHETIDSIDTSSGDAEYYDTTYTRFWSLVNLDNGDTIINNESDISSEVQHVVDGFIPSFSSATWEITGEDSTVFSPVDSSSASSIIFSGLGHPSASKKTWKSYLETLPSSSIGELGVDPMVSDLWNDLEIRFTNEGSIASYYNILTLYGMQEIDTVLVPFELWDIENNRQLNLAVYQSVGTSKPEGNIWALDSVIVIDSLFSSSSVVLDTSWTFGFKLKTSFQFIPGYDDYSSNEKLHYAQDTDKLGWVINLDQQNTYFNAGDIFRIHIANPLLPLSLIHI